MSSSPRTTKPKRHSAALTMVRSTATSSRLPSWWLAARSLRRPQKMRSNHSATAVLTPLRVVTDRNPVSTAARPTLVRVQLVPIVDGVYHDLIPRTSPVPRTIRVRSIPPRDPLALTQADPPQPLPRQKVLAKRALTDACAFIRVMAALTFLSWQWIVEACGDTHTSSLGDISGASSNIHWLPSERSIYTGPFLTVHSCIFEFRRGRFGGGEGQLARWRSMLPLELRIYTRNLAEESHDISDSTMNLTTALADAVSSLKIYRGRDSSAFSSEVHCATLAPPVL